MKNGHSIIRTVLAWLLVLATPAAAIDVNGQLKKAQLEKLSADPTSAEARIYYNTTAKKPKIYNGTSWTEIGSGSGGGGVQNLFENGNAEDVTTPSGWSTYADSGAAPTDGTGGTPTISAISRVTSSQIDGTASWQFVKPASNVQGQGWAYSFTVPSNSSFRNSQVSLNFDYYLSTAAVSDVFRIYVYDVTNGVLITPSFTTCGGGASPSLALSTATCQGKFAVVLTTGTSYRFLVHNASTSTTAVTMTADNFALTDYHGASGPGIGPEQTYSMTIGGSTSAPTLGTNTQEAAWSQAGENMLLRYDLKQTAAGSAGSGTYLFSIPAGHTIAPPTAVSATNALGLGVVGDAQVWDGTKVYTGSVQIYDTTHLYLVVGNDASTPDVFGSSTISLGNAAVRVSFTARFKIAEFVGGTAMGENHRDYLSYDDSSATAANTIYNTAAKFSSSPMGSPFYAMASTTAASFTKFRITTPRTIQPTDVVELLLSSDGGKSFSPMQSSGTIYYTNQGDSFYGGYVSPQVGSNYVEVAFGNKGRVPSEANGAAFAANGAPWSDLVGGTFRWAVRITSPGQVTFGLASSTSPGLVTAEESGTFTTSFTGARTISSVTVTYARVGKIVTLRWGAQVGASCTAGQLTSPADIPSSLRPPITLENAVSVQNSAALVVGDMQVTSAGALVFSAPGQANFTNGANCGFFAASVTYPIN